MNIEIDVQMPDLSFIRLCESRYGVNRGVYNAIDQWFYEQGWIDIVNRRKTILSFLARQARQPFGHGGLSSKLQEYCNLKGECS
ncbi:hypothetical protein [Ammoniphilus sp. YIM 78166]|uniref:hypothetical protein n=1 Tax=Ammoniphilus sp. YIM 78166 TaxID=1644106 RepID=UPI00106F2EFD|nr:hypothetical protein [Ammoniphilus sp. YIM 78166]